MAKMHTLDPAIKESLSPDWDLLATAGGFFADGLRARLRVMNGTTVLLEQLSLSDSGKCEAFAQKAHDLSGVPLVDIQKKLLVMADAVEEQLRTPSPPPQSGAPATAYEETPHGLVWLKPTMQGVVPTPLTNFTATIVEDSLRDDGSSEIQRLLTIEAQHDHTARQFQVGASAFAGMGWVIEQLGAGALLMPGLAIKDHARAAIQILSGDIPTRHLYTHSGWRKIDGDWCYLHGGGAIGAADVVPDILVDLEGVMARYVLPSPGAPEARQEAVRASLRLLDLGPLPVLLPLYAAVWRAALGHTAHSVHLVGQTGAGKSALAALMQQHYGAEMDASGLPGSWSSTGNSLETAAFLAKDALFTIDDFAPQGAPADIQRMYRDADRVLRAQGNGSGRQRLRPDGSLRPARPPRGVILSTGEDIPRGHSLRARLMILEVPPTLLQDHADAFTQCQQDARAGLYTQAMAGYVQWLAPQYEAIQQALPQQVAAFRDACPPGGHLRIPDMVGQLAFGWHTFLQYAESLGVMTDDEAVARMGHGWHALCEAAVAQDDHQASEDLVESFLTMLASAITAGEAHVASAAVPEAPQEWPEWGWRQEISVSDDGRYGPRTTVTWRAQGRRIGWRDGDRVYLDAEAAYSVAERFAAGSGRGLGRSPAIVWKRLHEHGLLRRDTSQKKHVVKRTVGGKRRYVLDLAADTLLSR